MKIPSLRSFFAALCAVALCACAFAGDPTGTWTYSMQGRNGGQARKATIKLAYKDGALTGSASGRNGDTAISDATFKDPDIAFTVAREFNGNKIVIKYSGKLDGDTITGKTSFNFNGEDRSVDWTATRSKDAAADAPKS